MKILFDINDIIALIFKRLYCVWDGKIFNSSQLATPSDFAKIPMDQQGLSGIVLQIYPLEGTNSDKQHLINVRISNDDFKISQGDNVHEDLFFSSYQDDWTQILLENHFEEYVQTYIDIYEKKCREIEKRYPLKGIFKKKRKMLDFDERMYNRYIEKLEDAKQRLADSNFGV